MSKKELTKTEKIIIFLCKLSFLIVIAIPLFVISLLTITYLQANVFGLRGFGVGGLGYLVEALFYAGIITAVITGLSAYFMFKGTKK